MVVAHFFDLNFIAGLHIAKHLQIAVPNAILENSCKDHIALIEREINNKRMGRLPCELEVVQHLEFLIEYLEHIGSCFQQIVLALLGNISQFLDGSSGRSINDINYLVLVGNLGVCRGDDFVLLKDFVFVVGFIDPPDIFDYVLGKLTPLQMPIPVNVDRLKEFYEVRYKVVLTYFVLRGVELLHEVDKGGQLQSLWVELEFLLENLHVLLGKHRHDALHVFAISPLLLEDMRVEVEIVDQFCKGAQAHFD